MKKYESPIIVEAEDLMEGVYAASGDGPADEPIVPIQGCWSFACRWDGHNSGGHSVCHVQATHSGDHSGSCLVMNVKTNFPIQDVKNASGMPISNVGTYNFTLTRNNHFNPTESVGFCFEIVTSAVLYDENGNALHGAIGTHNADSYYCTVVSYSCS